ncbi:MAG: transposase [Rhizomicrobium sp.]
MARLPRIVVPGCPHHVTARGNRREPIFFEDGDQDIYCDVLAEQMRKAQVEVWAYCLMPNHVHLILCPDDATGLARALGAAHKRWANFINGRGRWRGHLFDGRFASVAMDDAHLIACLRYVALNPVRARLAAIAHLAERRAVTLSAPAWPLACVAYGIIFHTVPSLYFPPPSVVP